MYLLDVVVEPLGDEARVDDAIGRSSFGELGGVNTADGCWSVWRLFIFDWWDRSTSRYSLLPPGVECWLMGWEVGFKAICVLVSSLPFVDELYWGFWWENADASLVLGLLVNCVLATFRLSKYTCDWMSIQAANNVKGTTLWSASCLLRYWCQSMAMLWWRRPIMELKFDSSSNEANTFGNDSQRFVALMHLWAKMNMASGSSGVMMGPLRMSWTSCWTGRFWVRNLFERLSHAVFKALSGEASIWMTFTCSMMTLAMPEVRAWSSCRSCEADRSRSSTSRLIESFQGRNSTGLLPSKMLDLLERSRLRALPLSFASLAFWLIISTEELLHQVSFRSRGAVQQPHPCWC